jgi:molybdopterin converting factor small subunit
MNEFQVVVEFTGVSRMLTGQSEMTIKIRQGTTFSEIVKLLGKKFPSMVGQIIEKDGSVFIATNLFSLNGQQIIQESEMNGSPKEGDRLILISLLAGG